MLFNNQSLYPRYENRTLLNTSASLQVDTLNKSHMPTINRVDSRYDFFETDNGVGSISMFFCVNNFGTQAYSKLIGTYTRPRLNGWMIGVKSNGFYFNMTTTGGYTSQTFFFVAATIKVNTWYHLVVNKTGLSTYEFYLNGIKLTLPSTTPFYNGAFVPTTYPITIAAKEQVEDTVNNLAIISVAHISFFDKVIALEEIQHINSTVGTILVSLHPNCVGYWACQESSGNKLFDSIEQFNYTKPQCVINSSFDTNSSNWSIYLSSGGEGDSAISWENGMLILSSTNATYPRVRVGLKSITYTAGWYEVRTKLRLYKDGVAQSGCGFRVEGITDVSFNTNVDHIYRFYYPYNQAPSLVITTFDNMQNSTIRLEVEYFEVYKNGKPINPNHADLINYTGTANVLNHADVTLPNADWTFSGGSSGTLSLSPTGVQSTASFACPLKKGIDYCLRFTATGGNGILIFLGAYGDYSNTSIVKAGENIIYFKGNLNASSNSRIFFLINATPIGAFTVTNLNVEELPNDKNVDFYTKNVLKQKLKFTKSSQYLELPLADSGDLSLINATSKTVVIDLSAEKITTSAYLYVDNAFSIWLGDGVTIGITGSTQLIIKAELYHGTYGALSRATAYLGTDMFLNNSRIIVTYLNDATHFRELKIAVNGVVLATATGNVAYTGTAIQNFGIAPYLFKVDGTNINKIEAYRFQVYTWNMSNTDITLYGKFRDEFDSQWQSYSLLRNCFVGKNIGLLSIAAAGKNANYIGFTLEELESSLVYERDKTVRLKNAVKLPPSSNPILLPTSIDLGTNAYTIFHSFYLPDDNPAEYPFLEITCDGGTMYFQYSYLYCPLSAYYLSGGYNTSSQLNKGINTLSFSVNGNKLEGYLNGVKFNVNHAGYGLSPNFIYDYPTPNHLYLKNITNHKIYSNYNHYAINYGIYKGVLTTKEITEIHNNAALNNPFNLTNWECYYQFNSNQTTWLDLTGRNTAITNPYSGNSVDPNHPDYKVYPIEPLKFKYADKLSLFNNLELLWDCSLPTSQTDTNYCNTIDTTGGTTTYSRLFDLSWNGRHGTFNSKSQQFIVRSDGSMGATGTQYTNLITSSAKVYSFIILTNAQYPSGSYMWLAQLHEATVNGALSIGDSTGSFTGETFTWHTGQNDSGAALATAMEAAIPAGFNVIAGTMTNLSGNDGSLYFNGISQPLLTATSKIAYSSNMNFRLGANTATSGNCATADFKKVAIFSKVLTAKEMMEAVRWLTKL